MRNSNILYTCQQKTSTEVYKRQNNVAYDEHMSDKIVIKMRKIIACL